MPFEAWLPIFSANSHNWRGERDTVMIRCMKQGGKLALALLCLIMCYTLLLLAVYAIPDRFVEPAVPAALGV